LLRTVLIALVTGLLWPQFAAAAPVPVRFPEGLTHGFLVLRTLEGELIASGDLLQSVRAAQVESRMVFRFKDGSLLDEKVVFTQEGVFLMQSYRLLQKGPVFGEDTEISLERASGKYRVTTTDHLSGAQAVTEGTLALPPDTYNGMVINIAKNLPKGAQETVHIVAFMPAAKLVELQVTQAGEHKVLVGELAKSATHYVFSPRPGAWLTFLATLLGRMPPDSHAWIVTDELPAFVRFEGPLHPAGAAWRIELTSPRWPD